MKVIKIGAIWCNGCLVMRPRWNEIEKEYPWLETEYFDFDADKSKIEEYKIDSGVLPVAIFLNKNGNEILRLQGEKKKDELVSKIISLKDQ